MYRLVFSEIMENREDSQASASGCGCLILVFSIGLIVWILMQMGNVQKENNIAQQLEVQAAAAEAKEVALQTDGILFRITQRYGYSSFYDTWGGERVMFIPEEAWTTLSFEEKDFLEKHAESSGIESIITGKIKSHNVIYVDRTVWERY